MRGNIFSTRAIGLILIMFLGTDSIRYVQGIEQLQGKPGDELVIQEQIDVLGKEGGVVELKAKTYLINRAIVVRDNVSIKGAGMDKTIIRMADGVTSLDVPSRVARLEYADRTIFRNENCDEQKTPEGNHDIVIRDLTIDGNTANNPRVSEGIFLANCYNYRIENVHVKNCRGCGGILTNPSHQAKRDGIKYKNYILNSIVEGNQPAYGRDAAYGHGIYVTAWDNDNVLVKGCIVRDNHASGIHGEDGIAYFFVEENEIYGNKGAGIWFCEVRNGLIKRNRIHHNGASGILMSQAEGNRNNLVCENDIHHNMDGIQVSNPYGKGNYHAILSNRIWNNRGPSICINKNSTGNTLAFNLCYDEGGEQVQGGIVVESAGNRIINNYIDTKVKDKIQLAEGNTLIEWKGRKPITPETLKNGINLNE